MISPRRYAVAVLAIAGSIVALIVAVNVILDPYNYFG
jgi:hypothetical protein